MKTVSSLLTCCILAVAAVTYPPVQAAPLGSSFSYQGRLSADGGGANGPHDFQFRLFAAETNGTAVAGPVNVLAVPVSNGLFQAVVDFGAGAFDGEERWLEIAVKNSLTDDLPHLLSPRQPITATPHALHAVNAGRLTSFANAPLDIKINGERVMRYEPAAVPTLGFMPNLIGGSGSSLVATGNHGVTLGGGGRHLVADGTPFSTIGGGVSNRLDTGTAYSVIGGGEEHSVSSNSHHVTIGGGRRNRVGYGSDGSTINGGVGNAILNNVPSATIGGGESNQIHDGGLIARHVTIAGGGSNVIMGRSERSTIGGGANNRISSDAPSSVIAGGAGNAIDHYNRFGTIGGGGGNHLSSDNYGTTIAGGLNNMVGGAPGVLGSAIGGGIYNKVVGLSHNSTIAGGRDNTILAVNYSAIGGGQFNVIQAGGLILNAHSRTISGGLGNLIDGIADGATVSGGQSNQANGPYSTVAGGQFNIADGTNSFATGFRTLANGDSSTALGRQTTASGSFSTAMGYRAQASNDGAFVWADSQDTNFASTGPNQFLIRAAGGVGINTDAPQFPLHVNGDAGKPGGGAWSVASDARLKKEIRPLEQALARLLQLHGVTYEYKDPKAIHERPGQQTGMIAQEVEKVFPDWVETAPDGMRRLSIRGFEALAVEALRELRIEKDTQISALEKRLAALEAKLAGGSPSER